jgi:hypothetical protein
VSDTRLEREFRAFHAENPHVYEDLVDLAWEVKGRGSRHYGIAALFEVLRWKKLMKTFGGQFKLNNNYRAYYAREIMENERGLFGFFETRHVRGDEEP